MRVLGIDPGLTRMGIGLVLQEGNRLQAIGCDTLVTRPEDSVPQRLRAIRDGLEAAVARWSPDVVAIERIFHKMNAQTVIPVAQASGVALLTAACCDLPVFDYAPLQVKMAVVGTGNATKDQVAFMVKRLLRGNPQTATPDAADALAVAICHCHSRKLAGLEAAARRLA